MIGHRAWPAGAIVPLVTLPGPCPYAGAGDDSIALLEPKADAPSVVDRYRIPAAAITLRRRPNDLAELRRFRERPGAPGMARACPEASGACNVRHRAFASWSMHGDVIAHAGKAQHRLHTSYRRLAMRARPQIAVAAVARALAGYLRAAMQDTPESVAVA